MTNESGCRIATSGWECSENVAIYFLKEGTWKMSWFDIELTDFCIENLPTVNLENKISFPDWLLEQGIEINDWGGKLFRSDS